MPGQYDKIFAGVGMLHQLIRGKGAYFTKIKALFGSSLIGYWPLWEVSGTTVEDISGNGRNGAYTGGVTVNSAISPVVRNAPMFDGVNSRCNIYSAGLAGAFSGAEGSIFFWAKIAADQWSDAAIHHLFILRGDDFNNQVRVYIGSNGLFYYQYIAAAISESLSFTCGLTDWMHIGITWSKSNERVLIYFNGSYLGALTALGIWSGVLAADYANIGTVSTSQDTEGLFSQVVLLNSEATQAKVRTLSRMSKINMTKFGIIGDSIANDFSDFPFLVGMGYNNGQSFVANHAVAGVGIINGMDAQVTASASDDSNIIIMELGTNDNNAGNMATLQAEVEENITELKVSNPHATIYYMNVLPRWTNNGGLTEVDKGNIRTAIAAACAAKSITCWDTYTAPWITAAQTLDGLHPTAAGHAAIAVQVLARL